MWVFHSPEGPTSHPVFLYEYLGGRNGVVLEKYLKGYKGTLVIDGYQAYHTLMKKDGGLKVAGYWAHARRKFAEIIKASRKGQALTPAQEAASEAIRLIDMIYHRDNSFKKSSTEERLTNRQQTVALLVDAYFAWVKQTRNKICGSQKLTETLNYSF